MRIITVGDIHGRDYWKEINPDEYDLIIFIGDYVDSFTHSGMQCLENLREIVKFKETYGDKVVLLLGNHDIHYMYTDTQWRGSGFDSEMLYYYKHIFSNHYYFQYAFQIKNFLWTHAGVNKCWFNEYIPKAPLETLAETINDLVINRYVREALFNVGYGRKGSGFGGPIWGGRIEMYRDPLPNFTQIVGHTPVKKIEKEISKDDNSTVYYTDCLKDTKDFLILDI